MHISAKKRAGRGRRGPRCRSRPGTSPATRREGLSGAAQGRRTACAAGSSSRSVRVCCTLEDGAPAGRWRVFRMIPRFFLERRFSVDGLPCAEGGRSAHGRISMALNTEVFPHDSADLPRAGPGRMCSAAPTVPRTAHWARHRRPDTPDPAARATTPRGSPEKPRPGVRPRRRPHTTTPNPASEPRRLLGGRWCGGGGASLGASLSVVAIPAGPQAGSWRRLLLGPLKFRGST